MAQSAQLQQVRYRHEAIADFMIANPEMDQNQIAEALGITATWLSVVVNSDAFRDYLDCRREEHNVQLSERVVDLTVNLAEKTQAVAGAALDRLNDRLNRPDAVAIPTKELTNTAARMLSALGFGAAPGGDRGRSTTNNFFVGSAVSQEALDRARSKLLNANADSARDVTPTSKEVLDGEAQEVDAAATG